MPISTITTKGQVTIPKEVRDALHLEPGVRVSFLVRDDGVVEMRAETVDLRSLLGILKVDGRRRTLEEMDEAIRRAAAGR